jgi:Dolichyl-phosphate-mannose-protein mannosyltransferase
MQNRLISYFRHRLANTDENWCFQTLSFFVLTLLTRLPFRSRFLYDHDSVQFALGMRDYDVYLNQPHPPGYFLYVNTARLINYFVQDANVSLIWVSIVASALTVAVIYNLGSAIFGRREGWWAALVTTTSPLFWFFGEVALTYVVAACFAALAGLLTWRLLNRCDRSIYLFPVVLGVAAGFRQDLLVFLGPLWLIGFAKANRRTFAIALLLLLLTLMLWFVPMLIATGGSARYFSALSELWQYNNAPQSVWHSQVASPFDTLLTLLGFLSYGVGIGTIFLLFSVYAIFRTGEWRRLAGNKLLFFASWLAPALLFFGLVFIPPYKYSYGLVIVPAFLLLTPPAVRNALGALKNVTGFSKLNGVHAPTFILALIVGANSIVFCLAGSGFSVSGLRTHDRLLAAIFSGIRNNFPSQSTVILGRQRSTFSGYRHIQYYLPEYPVYLADQQSNLQGQPWYVFGARDGRTTLSKHVEIPPGTERIVFLADPYFPESNSDLPKMNLRSLRISDDYTLFYKEIEPAERTAAKK